MDAAGFEMLDQLKDGHIFKGKNFKKYMPFIIVGAVLGIGALVLRKLNPAAARSESPVDTSLNSEGVSSGDIPGLIADQAARYEETVNRIYQETDQRIQNIEMAAEQDRNTLSNMLFEISDQLENAESQIKTVMDKNTAVEGQVFNVKQSNGYLSQNIQDLHASDVALMKRIEDQAAAAKKAEIEKAADAAKRKVEAQAVNASAETKPKVLQIKGYYEIINGVKTLIPKAKGG